MQVDALGIGLVGVSVTLLVFWLISRHQHWELRRRMMRALLRRLGILDESAIFIEDEIVNHARRGETVKLYILLIICVPAEIIVFVGGAAAIAGYIGFSMSLFTTIAILIILVAGGYYGGLYSYVLRHVKHPVWSVDLYDPYTKMELRADWALAQEPQELRFDDPVFQETYQAIKGTRPDADPLVQAMKKTDNHRYLVERTFLHDEDDPWRRFLLLTDCPLSAHEHQVTKTTYVGIFPVRMLCTPIGLEKVDVLPVPLKPGVEGEQEVQEGRGIPVAVICASKELRRRILYGEKLPEVDRKDIAAGEMAVQGLLNVEAAQKIRVLEKTVASQNTMLATWAASSGGEAANIMELAARTKAQPPAESKVKIPRKWLKVIAGIVIGLVALALLLFVGLPLLLTYYKLALGGMVLPP